MTGAARISADALMRGPIELNLAATNLPNMDFLSKSDPFAVIYVRPASGASGWRRLGKTEIIWDDLNPKWCSSFILPKLADLPASSTADFSASTASFQSAGSDADDQLSPASSLAHAAIRVDVYDWDKDTDDLAAQDFIGRTETTYGQLFDAAGHSIELTLKDPKRRGKDRGKLQLVLDTIAKPPVPLAITFAVSATSSAVSNKKTCIVISKRLLNNVWTPVYRSEDVKCKEPAFKELTLSVENLCAGQPDRSIRIELYRVKRNAALDQAGFLITSLKSLSSLSPGSKLQWWSPNSGLQMGGAVLVSAATAETSSSYRLNIPG